MVESLLAKDWLIALLVDSISPFNCWNKHKEVGSQFCFVNYNLKLTSSGVQWSRCAIVATVVVCRLLASGWTAGQPRTLGLAVRRHELLKVKMLGILVVNPVVPVPPQQLIHCSLRIVLNTTKVFVRQTPERIRGSNYTRTTTSKRQSPQLGEKHKMAVQVYRGKCRY